MIPIAPGDLDALRRGMPPRDDGLLARMTLGAGVWLDPTDEHCLENFLPDGGSKVKILVGNEGTGKTHVLRALRLRAAARNYLTVSLTLRETSWNLANIITLYKTVAAATDREVLCRGLCRAVAAKLGYGGEQYDGSASILPLLMTQERLSRETAAREVRKAIAAAFEQSDLSPGFRAFVDALASSRAGLDNPGLADICWRWFLGEKLSGLEQRASHLFDRLNRQTARVWLYSLIKTVRLAGMSGVVLLIDDLEALTERSPETHRLMYTPNAAKDTFELIRQLIDDTELVQHFLLVMAGRPEAVEDERRGIRSYEALWMRLQTGLVPAEQFNPWADMISADRHLAAVAGDAPIGERIAQRLSAILERDDLSRRYLELPELETASPIRRAVMETAHMIDGEEVRP